MIFVVEVTKKQYEEYNIYYNNILMPTFIDNSISSNNEYNQNYNKYYNSFQLVNKKFAKALCVFADMNDLIMINDMNLCLIPNALAQNRKNNWRIGIFIHLCFPASDVFKAFPNSIDIMYSLILCDVIGFHVFQYARNFITVLERVFWIFPIIKNKGYMTLEYLGKYSFIFIKYCGCDNDKILKIINEKEDKNNEMIEERRNYINYIDKYKKIIKDKLSIVSIDNAIEMTELILKFNSYKIYLEQNKEKQGKTILIEIISYKNTYKNNLERINEEVKKIKNEKNINSMKDTYLNNQNITNNIIIPKLFSNGKKQVIYSSEKSISYSSSVDDKNETIDNQINDSTSSFDYSETLRVSKIPKKEKSAICFERSRNFLAHLNRAVSGNFDVLNLSRKTNIINEKNKKEEEKKEKAKKDNFSFSS